MATIVTMCSLAWGVQSVKSLTAIDAFPVVQLTQSNVAVREGVYVSSLRNINLSGKLRNTSPFESHPPDSVTI
jgi:hypothetical protein